MKRLAMVIVVLTALALPAAASANYNLSLDGANTLVISPGAESSIAVDYTAFCLQTGPCATGQTVNSANNATRFDDPGNVCTDNSVVNPGTSFSCNSNNINTTRVVGTATPTR